MDFVINVGLPLSLAIIMLSLGVGLEARDFHRVLTRRFPFAIGALCQVLLLPIIAFVIVTIFALSPEIAVGFMLLSFCPGGVTSNMLTKLAGGDVALSVTLTAVISLLSILTVPFLAAWSVNHFLAESAPEVSVTDLAIAMFVITTLPVALGVTIRHYFRGLALAIDAPLSKLATGLFVLIVAVALAGNWTLFVENLGRMGTGLVTLNLVLLATGLALGRLTGLAWTETKTVAIETGIQNSTLGIALAALITNTESGISPLALPAAVYGITMYVIAIPVLIWFRRR